MARSNGHRERALPSGVGAMAELAALVDAAQDPKSSVELRERMAEIEFALEDLGWVRMDWQTQGQLSRGGLRRLTSICRMLYLKHPLIHHAVDIHTHYVWGQGLAVVAKAAEVNAVVQSWWDLRPNKAELTGHRARMLKERELKLAGQIFLVLFTEPIRGTVLVRSIDPDEVEEIVCNPEDRREPWFYYRKWKQGAVYDPALGVSTKLEPAEAYYPDWLYRPTKQPATIAGVPVRWDSPVYHMKVGGLDNMHFGVPEIFSAIDWARAVQVDLENYATVRKAYARFAFALTSKGGPNALAAAKAMLGTTISAEASTGEHNPAPVPGSTWLQREGNRLEPIRTAGAQPHPDEGRRLGLMAGAGMGMPETMLWGDATQGNYATAKSLDRPTELQFIARQQDWTDTFIDVLGYVVDSCGLARKGVLRAKLEKDEYSGEEHVLIIGADRKPLDRRIDVAYPAILEHDSADEVQAIVTAATLNGGSLAGLVDERTLARLLLVALRVNNVDEVLDRLHPDEPNPPAEVPPPQEPPAPFHPPAAVPPEPAPPELPAEVPPAPTPEEVA